MKLASAFDYLLTRTFHPRVFNQELKYLFLFSHMRSRSSLLSHLLGNHPEIVGYKEHFGIYNSNKHFQRLRLESWKEFHWDSPKYLLDKILHPHLTPTQNCFDEHPIRSIFFLRKPDQTIPSIVSMWKKRKDPMETLIENATTYYCDRIREITELATRLDPATWIFFDSNRIVTDTDQVLAELQTFLELTEPLSKTYKLFEGTGKPRLGDPSKYIKAGKVLTLDKNRYEHIQVSNALKERAEEVYIQATETLENCQRP